MPKAYQKRRSHTNASLTSVDHASYAASSLIIPQNGVDKIPPKEKAPDFSEALPNQTMTNESGAAERERTAVAKNAEVLAVADQGDAVTHCRCESELAALACAVSQNCGSCSLCRACDEVSVG